MKDISKINMRIAFVCILFLFLEWQNEVNI